jgi:hypothetical protein
VIKAQAISIRNSDQKKIEKDFQGGKISQETLCDKAMIDPAERAFNLSDTVWAKKFFDIHEPHLLAS